MPPNSLGSPRLSAGTSVGVIPKALLPFAALAVAHRGFFAFAFATFVAGGAAAGRRVAPKHQRRLGASAGVAVVDVAGDLVRVPRLLRLSSVTVALLHGLANHPKTTQKRNG